MKVLHVLPGLDSGRAQRMAANPMRTLDRERLEAGVIGLLDPPFDTDLEETLARDGIRVRPLGKRRGFDPRTFVRPARVLGRVGLHVGSALPLRPQGLAQCAPALGKHQGLH
jgi:hypothetical protein